uniref:Endonuclease/exonuclease/phosphatase domain-containing protein n=1 Tax=Kalanchoe fedtschenkoi TaxID=63787 RepID=A0A7N0SYF6_KALFE
MLRIFNFSLRRLCRRLRWPIRRGPKTRVSIRRFEKTSSAPKSKSRPDAKLEIASNGSATVYPNNQLGDPKSEKPIRVATFNAALFSMAPAVPKSEFGSPDVDFSKLKASLDRAKSVCDRPKSILKQSPLHSSSLGSSTTSKQQQKLTKSKMRVSINLPDNEISLLKNWNSSFREGEHGSSASSAVSRILRGSPTVSFPANVITGVADGEGYRSSRTVVDVLRELGADVLALQDVKAEEEKGMKPLSDLAEALGMHYVFAESWAPEYGNAILSKWPIKKSNVQQIFDDSDFRNVLKATIDVPDAGEVNFHCTLLDHLDENWRMKQINAIIQSDSDEPHILAGGLNSLDETDYSLERWTDIVKVRNTYISQMICKN